MKLYTNKYFKPQIAFQNIYLLPFKKGLPGWLGGIRFCLRCRTCRFDPWVRKIPWRRKWQPTPGFLPRKMPWTGAWQATVRRITKSRTWLSNCVHGRMPCNKREFFPEGVWRKLEESSHSRARGRPPPPSRGALLGSCRCVRAAGGLWGQESQAGSPGPFVSCPQTAGERVMASPPPLVQTLILAGGAKSSLVLLVPGYNPPGSHSPPLFAGPS